MTKLRDKLYLWGQTSGAHHRDGGVNVYQLPGKNRMTPAEGCAYFGIPNCCRVVMDNRPAPPFDEESSALAHLREVVWSIIGSGGSDRNDIGNGDLDEVIRQARRHPNITGAVLDDFLNPRRMDIFPPARLAEIRNSLRRAAGRPLDLWVVWYEFEMNERVRPYLAECDVVTFWTWHGKHLDRLPQNLEAAAEAAPSKRLLAGCYMWNYGERRPLTAEQMRFQLDTLLEFLESGRIDGAVVCSNCIADLGIPEVEQVRRWIAENGERELTGAALAAGAP